MKAGKSSEAPFDPFVAVLEFFHGDTEKAGQWFTLPNPMLGSVRPIDMLMLGRGEKLSRFVRRQLADNGVSSVGSSLSEKE